MRSLALDHEHTLEEVGKAIGVTRERARQIERAALRKLRAALEREGLSFEDLIGKDRCDE